MFEKVLRLLRAMELEEKVIHVGALLCLAGLLMPWVGIQLYGNTQQWGGFGYHTGYIGQAVFLMQIFILAMTLSPMLGGPILVRKANRSFVRLLISTLCTCLIFAAFSILLRLTFEVSGAEVRFGIYIALVGSAVTSLYSLLRYQDDLRTQGQASFRHPDESTVSGKPPSTAIPEEAPLPPPPPPPPPQPPEDHRPYNA